MKKIVFFKVTTGLDRHSFDECVNWEEVKEMLNELEDEEFRVYDLESQDDVHYMCEDYNDMIIDGECWWCYLFWEN